MQYCIRFARNQDCDQGQASSPPEMSSYREMSGSTTGQAQMTVEKGKLVCCTNTLEDQVKFPCQEESLPRSVWCNAIVPVTK